MDITPWQYHPPAFQLNQQNKRHFLAKKGEQKLKLRIKRISMCSAPEVRNPASLTVDTTPPTTTTTKKSFDHSLISALNVIQQPAMISPDTRLTRRTAAILKNSPQTNNNSNSNNNNNGSPALLSSAHVVVVSEPLPPPLPRNVSEIANRSDLYDTQEEEEEEEEEEWEQATRAG